MFDFKVGAAAAALMVLAGCATTEARRGGVLSSCDGFAEANRKVVLAFYHEGLMGLEPRTAFERHMTPDFVEHKPDVPHGTREASAAFLEQLIDMMISTP